MVDDENRLVGIVTHDDVIDVVVQEATEDVHMMGAVQPLAENYLDAPFVAVIQIIVYAGAIMVLFLFVVMLLNAPREDTDEDVARVYPAETYQRLASVKQAYDPHNLFAGNYNVRPR